MPSIINTSRVAVVGLGQLGGSLARRLKELSPISLYAVARREESLRAAIEAEIIEAGSTDPAEILPVVDLAFICLPIPTTVEFVTTNIQHFRTGSIVTDVSSVKGLIVRELRDRLYQHGTYFIGSHPMAGSEKTGFDHSRADLYKDVIVFLTPTPEDEPDAIHLLTEFWREIGALPIELDAERHDGAVSFASHVPHLIASALARTVLSRGDTEANSMACAGGFQDMTRIASSDTAMWTEVTQANSSAVLAALDAFEEEMAAMRRFVETEDWDGLRGFLDAARSDRNAWNAAFENHHGFAE